MIILIAMITVPCPPHGHLTLSLEQPGHKYYYSLSRKEETQTSKTCVSHTVKT